jgi:hypothetical protein
MHEAGLVGRALDRALSEAPIGPGGLVLEVLDPVGLSVDATLLHLEVVLAEHGLAGVPVSLHVAPVRCAGCGESGVPEFGDLFCASCGWPLPRQEGPPLRIRPLATATAAPGG